MATINDITVGRSITSAKLDGVQFNNISNADGQGLAKKWNRLDGPWKTAGSTTLNAFAINAVDIDWNGAQWPSTAASQPTTINTTGDLLKAIKWASQQGGSDGGTTYEVASTDNLGLIKIFDTTSIVVNSGTNRNYGVKLDKNNKAYVYVPWQEYVLSAASSGTLGGIKEGYYGELPSSYGLKFGVKVNLDEPNTPKYGCAYIGIPFASSNHAGLMPSAMFSKLNNISTNSSGGGNYSNASSTSDGLMSSANYIKLDSIPAGANKIDFASSTADGSINLKKWTESSSYTLLSFVSGSSFTLSSTDLAVSDDGEIYPVILDSHNKPFVKVPVSTNSSGGGNYSNASSTGDGLMSSANYVKLEGITNNANRIELASTDGSINLVKYTKSTPSTLLSFVSNSSFTLPSSDLAIGDGKNFPVILDAENKPYVNVDWHDTNTEYNIYINGSSQPSTTDRVNNWTSIYAPTTSGSIGQILKSNGANISPTWTNLSTASTSTDGLMSSAMFTKLNNVESEAHASVTAPTSIGVSPSSYTLTVTYGITQIQLDEYGHVIGIA